MLAEYLKINYSKFPTIQKQPLGAIDEEIAKKEGMARAIGLMRPFRPEIDGIVILPGALLLVEAKVWNVVNGLAKLPLYASLVPYTPELKQHRHLHIIMELVVGWTYDNLEIMARDAGVRVRVYCPPWLEKVKDEMHNYWTSDYRRAREDKLKMREHFGIE